MTDFETEFAERKRRARVTDALRAVIEGAKPYETDDFVDVVGRFMRPDEDTFDARRRLQARLAELTDAVGSGMEFDEARELLDLARLARHQGADWKKARQKHRATVEEAIPAQPWGNEDELNERREAMHKERQEARKAMEARLAALEAKTPQPAPEPEPEPETHFADLMLADETIDDARERLSQRLRELRHYLIAPEIKVNEDGSVGLTAGEQAELADLERRQTLGRWLEA